MKKKGLTITLLSLAAACIFCLGIGYWLLLAPQFHPEKKAYIYIDRDDTADSVYHKLSQTAAPGNLTGLRWAASLKQYPSHSAGRQRIPSPEPPHARASRTHEPSHWQCTHTGQTGT